jgi:tetratricopeptide (TPR) repeat protein
MRFGCTTGKQEIPEPRARPPHFAEEAKPMTASGHYDAYTAFSEGMRLLSDGNAHAAVIALEQARQLEPAKSSVREALARAYFRTGRFAAAEQEFIATLDIEPVNDYAQYGVGLCRLKAGDRARARGHLRLATVMRPDNADYQAALEQVIDADTDTDAHDHDGPPEEEQPES